MTTQSPLQIVKARFKDKAGLVSAVEALAKDDLWNDRRLNTDKELDSVSNKKLLHLHDVLSQVKKEFGSRAKLIDAIATAQGRAKDADFKKGLERHSTPRLFEYLSVSGKRAKKK
jgi:hypothetical protein